MDYKYVNGNQMKSNQSNILDQYFTKREVSHALYLKTIQVISQYEKDISAFTWLEPSVGEGCFYDNLPQDKRIGIDIEPQQDDIIKSDYLDYQLPTDERLIVIGNPPFGHRGVLALEFIQHSQQAEYVAFILPMFFRSLGKGSIRYRVKGFNLLYEENLPDNSFYLANGKSIDVKCCFQIWSKNHSKINDEFNWYSGRQEPFKEYIKLVTVSLAKKRECGKEWIFNKRADWYLSSSFFKDNRVVKSFDEVKYKSGIAIIYVTDDQKIRAEMDRVLVNADWTQYASLATNGCYHIGKSNIYKLLQEKLEDSKMDINSIMEDIINRKYEELHLDSDVEERFIKIRKFEGNAVGQIGEAFVKKVFRELHLPMDDIGREVVHDEYDIISNGRKIEIKTARKGLKNNSYQFNGINPIYNHDYIILLGITTSNLYYNIISGACTYNHDTRKRYLQVNDKLRQLVEMNPGNTVNYKLTLTTKNLKDISTFSEELINLFGNK